MPPRVEAELDQEDGEGEADEAAAEGHVSSRFPFHETHSLHM